MGGKGEVIFEEMRHRRENDNAISEKYSLGCFSS